MPSPRRATLRQPSDVSSRSQGEGPLEVRDPEDADPDDTGGPDSLAEPPVGPSGEDHDPERVQSEPDKPVPAPLIVIEPCPEERRRLEASVDELGRPLHAVDPLGLALSDIAGLETLAGIVVVWDLGERTGLDWVEALAPLAASRQVPLAMASAVATRERVALAVRAGASHFVSSPCDIDELRLLIGSEDATHTAGDPSPRLAR